MNCPHPEEQISAWLDGEVDLSAHALECTDCQQKMAALQKLRSRLSAPPSPLGKDFARRTATHILRTSLTDHMVRQSASELQSSWWQRIRNNPLVAILGRERNRHLLRLPSLLGLLLLYLVPTLWANGLEADARWAYFGTVQLGIMVGLPLYLLSIEMTTLSSLVRGRCLEELLQTGLPPGQLCDTLAWNGLMALGPALALCTTCLLLVDPNPTTASWLPVSLITFWACSYLAQLALLGVKPARRTALAALLLTCAGLLSPFPWNLLVGVTTGATGWRARRFSIDFLQRVQAGQSQSSARQNPTPWQEWLIRRLPDLALLQRELRRSPRALLSPFNLLAPALALATFYVRGDQTPPMTWICLASVVAAYLSLNLVAREKESSSYELLLHSGLKAGDWVQSALWLNLIRMGPTLLVACFYQGIPVAFGYTMQVIQLLASAIVCLWAGTVVGVAAGLQTAGARQALQKALGQLAQVALQSAFWFALTAVALNSLSYDWRYSALEAASAFAWVFPVLFLYTRARRTTRSDFQPLNGLSLRTWLAGPLPLGLLAYVNLNSQIRLLGVETLLTGLGCVLWAWWWQPLEGKLRRASLKTWTLAVLSLLIWVLAWDTTLTLLYLRWEWDYASVLEALPGIHQAGWQGLGLWGLLLAGWCRRKAGSENPPSGESVAFPRRSLAIGTLWAFLLAGLVVAYGPDGWGKKSHPDDLKRFLQENSMISPVQGSTPAREIARRHLAPEPNGAYFTLGAGQAPLLGTPALTEAVRQLPLSESQPESLRYLNALKDGLASACRLALHQGDREQSLATVKALVHLTLYCRHTHARQAALHSHQQALYLAANMLRSLPMDGDSRHQLRDAIDSLGPLAGDEQKLCDQIIAQEVQRYLQKATALAQEANWECKLAGGWHDKIANELFEEYRNKDLAGNGHLFQLEGIQRPPLDEIFQLTWNLEQLREQKGCYPERVPQGEKLGYHSEGDHYWLHSKRKEGDHFCLVRTAKDQIVVCETNGDI